MIAINVRNVNDAILEGITLLRTKGEQVESRNGPTLEMNCPVATTYQRPWERVVLSNVRDANPFFHLMEAMWILAGRCDVKFLTEFNKRMADYSDDGEEFNAPYGYRMRVAVNMQIVPQPFDQIQHVISILRNDPNSRQAVIQIWDSEDLNKSTKDKACNMSVVFRIRKGALHMTVYNRSNDILWGAYGANVVQFSMLQEYVAAHLGVHMGPYTQITNSYHVYTTGPGGELWDKLLARYQNNSLLYRNSFTDFVTMFKKDITRFDNDLKTMFYLYDNHGLSELGKYSAWQSTYFKKLVAPMIRVHLIHKSHGPYKAMEHTHEILADDWRYASDIWLSNRILARNTK